MIWFYTKLRYFDNDDKLSLVYTLTSGVFETLSTDEQENLKFLFSRIDGTTSSALLKEIKKAIDDTVIRGKAFVVHDVSAESNFDLRIQKNNPSDNYDPYILVAREHATGVILTQKQATNDETQVLTFTDLNLTEDTIYKIRIQLEEDTGAGSTSGDAVAELTTLFFVVTSNIDSE